MAVSRNLATGKSRKSAGDLTYYTRLGVACFRQKPTRSPGYKSTVPQRMQQSVFRFIKTNLDESGAKSFIDAFYDAKPRKGKSETKMNMFYRAFMPHLVAAKQLIYELPEDQLNNPRLFLGSPGESNDRLTNGQLGTLLLMESTLSSMKIDGFILDQIIAKANQLISEKAVPFTANDVFVGILGANPSASTGYQLVQPTNIKPTLADGVYSFDISALTTGIVDDINVYVAILIAGVDGKGGIDITRRKFATDSAVLNGGTLNMVSTTISSVTMAVDNSVTMNLPKSVFDAGGIDVQKLVGAEGVSGTQTFATAKITHSSISGDLVACTVELTGSNEGDSLSGVSLSEVPMQFKPGSGGLGLNLTNSISASWEI